MDFPVMLRQSKKGNIVAEQSPKRLPAPKTSALCLRITSLKHSWDGLFHTGRLPSQTDSTSSQSSHVGKLLVADVGAQLKGLAKLCIINKPILDEAAVVNGSSRLFPLKMPFILAGDKKQKKTLNPKSAATASGLREAPSVALIEKRPPSMKSKQGCIYVILQRLFTGDGESAWRPLSSKSSSAA